MQTLGANVIDYSTWYDCCGFGFRHIISEREFTRSFAIDRKIKVANYYGCMYTRPRHIFPEKDAGPGSESTSKTHFMDDLLAAAGAENVDFPLKTACCGGAHTLSDSDMSTKLESRELGDFCCSSKPLQVSSETH